MASSIDYLPLSSSSFFFESRDVCFALALGMGPTIFVFVLCFFFFFGGGGVGWGGIMVLIH